MRSAPPVAVICDGGLAWAGLQAFLPALAGAAVAAWISAWVDLPPLGVAGAVFAAAAFGGLLGWHWLRPLPAPLVWDGACWSAGSPAVTGQVEVMVDLGGWLLLRFWPDAAATPVRWLVVSAAAAGGGLHGLRVALHGGPARPAGGPRSAERQPG